MDEAAEAVLAKDARRLARVPAVKVRTAELRIQVWEVGAAAQPLEGSGK